MEEYAVKLMNISKRFGKVVALNNVDFSLKKGEVHAILGENGAGKSSLMNVLNGIYQPDSGVIEIGGETVDITSPKIALSLGIGMLPQHIKLVEVFTAQENIIAGDVQTPFFINKKKMQDKIDKKLHEYEMEIDLDKKVYDMAVAEKQRVEIFKVLYRGASIMILDEPTAVLTPQEIENLFVIINRLKAKGCSIILITHKLNEVMAVSDRITVMRKGEHIETIETKDATVELLASKMVGDAMDLSVPYSEVERGGKLLEVKDICAKDIHKTEVLKHINFDLFSGEILGVAGIAGSGQKELCEGIAGLYHLGCGEIIYENENILNQSPEYIIKKGISLSFVPEDRLGMGLVPSMDIVDNVLLKDYQKQKGLRLSKTNARSISDKLVDQLDIVTPSVEKHPVSLLSGGNIQKVLLGREIDLQPQIMIVAYPVRGLDVGSSHRIYELINEQKKKGVAILYVGEDLDVLLSISDRIMVLCEGEITGIVNAKTTTKEQVGLLMAGQKQEGTES
jgi:simple sugar transport system ATP-binding protein